MMTRTSMVQICGACFALAAFAIAILTGLAADNAAATVLARALLALIVCYPVGMIVGAICRRLVHEHAARLAESAPVEHEDGSEESASSAKNEQEVHHDERAAA